MMSVLTLTSPILTAGDIVEIGVSSVDCFPDENPDTKDGASDDREDDGKEDADEE